MAARYGDKFPGSGTANPYLTGPQFHPLNNVTWIEDVDEVEVETENLVKVRIPAASFQHWVKQKFGGSPKYAEEIVRQVEIVRVPRIRKQYNG